MFAGISEVVFIFMIFAKLNWSAADLCSSPPPPMNSHECCDFPLLFEESTLDECGVKPLVKGDDVPSSCDNLTCVFKKENLIGDNQKINKEMAKEHIHKWSVSHPEWADNHGEIAEKCISDANLQSGPPDMCQPFKLILCALRIFLLSCPTKYWTSSEQCEQVKTYVQQCHAN